MRPKILHCVDDNGMGGVNFALQALCDSSLAKDYDFEIRYVDLTRLNRISTSADIICFHGASSWRKLVGLVWFKLQFPRTPFVLQEHHYCQHFVASQIPSVKRFYRMLKMSYALMDYVIAISPSQRQWMIANNLIAARAIELVGQGRDLSQFLSANTQTNKARRKMPTIAAYGRFHQQKGFDLLLQAMANIATNQCQLKLAGEGPQWDTLAKLALPLAHVELVSKVDKVADFLNACDAVIIPSRWEPFGLVFIEALAMQKWIISTKVDGLGDQLAEVSSCSSKVCVTPIKEVSVASITEAIEAFIADWQAAQASSMNDLGQKMSVDQLSKRESSLDEQAQVQLWSIEQWDGVQTRWRDLFTKILS